MNHTPYTDWMHQAVDNALPADQRRQLEAHLADCADCAAAWAGLLQVERLLARPPLAAPRAAFTARFAARARQRRAQPRVLWGAFALSAGVIGAGALILPVGVSVLWSLAQLIGQPAATAALVNSASATSQVVSTLADALVVAARALGEWALGVPLVWAGALAALAVTGAWIVLMRRIVVRGFNL